MPAALTPVKEWRASRQRTNASFFSVLIQASSRRCCPNEGVSYLKIWIKDVCLTISKVQIRRGFSTSNQAKPFSQVCLLFLGCDSLQIKSSWQLTIAITCIYPKALHPTRGPCSSYSLMLCSWQPGAIGGSLRPDDKALMLRSTLCHQTWRRSAGA